MKVYYWNRVRNFGDLLSPLLLTRFSRIQSTWAPAVESDIVLTGSVIDQLPSDYTGLIAGAGKLHGATLVPTTAKILALRGPLTAQGVRGTYALGDPGLLADELITRPDKLYNLGVVPHWTDHDLEHDTRFTRYNPKVIRVGDDPLEVIKQIGQCKKIVSSSLHGIILADAFGIPRRIEIAPRMISHPHQEGGLFKWKDYSESVGMKLEIGITKQPAPFIITERQHELYDMFKELRSYK